MRLLFYKLPSEAGENIIVTDSYAFVESELAILLDDADLSLPFFDIFVDGNERNITEVMDNPENVDPYFVVDASLTIDGTLPFKNEAAAHRFVDHILKWQEYINKAYDE